MNDLLRELSLAGKAFFGGGQLASSGSNFAYIQLFNPAASGVTVVLTKLLFLTTSGVGYGALTAYNTALTTNLTTLGNKLIDGAAPAAQVRSLSQAGVIGTQRALLPVQTAVPIPVPLPVPIILGEGKGIMTQNGTVGGTNVTMFEWLELP